MSRVEYRTAYTYASRGCAGSPSALKGVNSFKGHFHDSDLQVYKNLGRIIYRWNNDTDFWNFVKNPTPIRIPFFTPLELPETQGAPMDHLELAAAGDPNESACYIRAVDANGNVVRGADPYSVAMTGGVSISQLAYDRWCVQHTPATEPDIRYPVYLFFFADPDNSIVEFRIAGFIADENKQGDYSGLAPWTYTTVGDSSLMGEFYPWLLCDNYADSEGIAPEGEAGGGGGLYDLPDVNMDIPQLPTVSVCDTGMVSLYNINDVNLKALGNYLWNSSFVDTIKRNFQSPFDNIVSLQLVPFAPQGTTGNVIIGNVDTGVTAQKLATSFYSVNCGTLQIDEYGKNFADYAPYSKLFVSLPYVQIVELNTDDVMDGEINVVYHIDVFSGSCIAYVRCRRRGGNWHIVGQYAGNIAVQMPITGANFASVYVGAMTSLTSVGLGIASGGMGILAGGVAGAASAANIKPNFNRSGGVSGTSGYMAMQYPYLIRTTPNYIVAKNFRDVKGQVSNLMCTIGSERGFLQATADNSELSDIGCTSAEIEMIRKLLADGIYIRGGE